MPRPKVPSEAEEQEMVVKWLRASKCISFSVPNESGRAGAYARASYLKKTGLLSGVADIVIVTKAPANGQITFLEMKRRNGSPSDLSRNQDAFGYSVVAEGHNYVVGWGADDAINKLKYMLGYGGPRAVAGIGVTLIDRAEARELIKKDSSDDTFH